MPFVFLHGSGGGGSQPTLFTPLVRINYNTSSLIITDGNGDFAHYEIYAATTGDFSLVTTTINKTIDLTVLFPTHNSDIDIKVKAIGNDFISSGFSDIVTWQYGVGTEGLAYTLSQDGTHYICSGIGTATATDIVIGTIHEGLPVTQVAGAAFRNNTSITSVKIPDTVTSFTGGYVFAGCTSLRSAIVGNNVDFYPWGELFSGCTSLESVTLNNSITSIGYNCFFSCKLLTSITIPDSVTGIGGGAFYNCRSLTNITIPNNVKNIGSTAFDACVSLTSITILATNPPTLANVNAFSGNYPIYVPAQSVTDYQTATNWASLASRIQAIQE